MKFCFLQMFFLIFVFCVIASETAKKSGMVVSEATPTCNNIKQHCFMQNSTCKKIFKKVKKYCQYSRNNCIAGKEKESIYGKSKPESETNGADGRNLIRENCTYFLKELWAIPLFEKQCECNFHEPRSKKIRCKHFFNLVFANPCLVKKYDKYQLLDLYSKPTLSNNKETEKKYIINHKKNDMSTPIFEIVETESIKNVTISSFIVTTDWADEKSEQNETKDNFRSRTQQSCNMIIAFIISGVALWLLILLGIFIIHKKCKNKKRSRQFDESEVVTLKPDARNSKPQRNQNGI